MLLDNTLLFGQNIAVTGSASAVKSFTNVIQLDAVKRYQVNNASGNPVILNSVLNDLGRAGDVMLNVKVTSTQIAATSSATTLNFRLHKKSTASSIKSGTVAFNYIVSSIKKAASVQSFQKIGAYLLRIKIPKNTWGDTTNKFIGLTGKIGAAAITTGKVTAWLGGPDDDALNASS